MGSSSDGSGPVSWVPGVYCFHHDEGGAIHSAPPTTNYFDREAWMREMNVGSENNTLPFHSDMAACALLIAMRGSCRQKHSVRYPFIGISRSNRFDPMPLSIKKRVQTAAASKPRPDGSHENQRPRQHCKQIDRYKTLPSRAMARTC